MIVRLPKGVWEHIGKRNDGSRAIPPADFLGRIVEGNALLDGFEFGIWMHHRTSSRVVCEVAPPCLFGVSIFVPESPTQEAKVINRRIPEKTSIFPNPPLSRQGTWVAETPFSMTHRSANDLGKSATKNR
jgi:hypothetical protein